MQLQVSAKARFGPFQVEAILTESELLPCAWASSADGVCGLVGVLGVFGVFGVLGLKSFGTALRR